MKREYFGAFGNSRKNRIEGESNQKKNQDIINEIESMSAFIGDLRIDYNGLEDTGDKKELLEMISELELYKRGLEDIGE